MREARRENALEDEVRDWSVGRGYVLYMSEGIRTKPVGLRKRARLSRLQGARKQKWPIYAL
jgi:hypothetical protein